VFWVFFYKKKNLIILVPFFKKILKLCIIYMAIKLGCDGHLRLMVTFFFFLE
jgi:hypothetical protein